MKRPTDFIRSIQLVTAAAVLSNCVALIAQQQPPTVTRPSGSSVQVSPRSGPSPYGNVSSPATGLKLAVGSITGFVYWQMNVLQPQSTCQGLTVKVVTVSKSGMPLQLLSSSSTLTAMGPVTDNSAPGTPKYMLCSYSFHNMPENVSLRALLYGPPPSTSVVIPSAFQIPSGNCNATPSSALSFILTGGEMLCGDNAFNINFKLTSKAVAAPRPTVPSMLLPHAPSPGGMLSQPQAAPGNAATPAPNMGATLLSPNPGSAPGNASNTPVSNGMLASAPKSGGAGSIAGAGGFTGGVRPALPAGITGGMRIISGRRVQNAAALNSSIIAVLRQQKQTGFGGPEHTMASGGVSAIIAQPPNLRMKAVAPPYSPSNLLTAQENAWCQQREAQGLAPAILRVDGKSKGEGVVYSPDPQANPYSIVGCGFGSGPGTVKLELDLDTGTGNVKPLYTLSLLVVNWGDHEIVASLDPNTSHVPDWNESSDATYLAILSSTGRTLAGPSEFFARRQTVLLSSVPQNEASLYQQGTPYFLSPVSNYYGLNGTAGVMRQGLAPNSVAGQDTFALQLAAGFVVDSTQTDLLVSNISANVSSQPATVNGNTITVTYPVLSSGSGNGTNYYSIYGLKVWVTGPAGILPITPAP